MSLFEYIKRLDRFFFILIHNDSEHKVLDGVMLVLRNPLTWVPLYIFMIFFIIKKTGKRAWLFIVLSLVTVAFTYCISAFILQPLFAVLSPCFDPEIHKFVRGIIDCGGMYSFPSAHTADNFGIAAFWFWSLYKITGKKRKWLWVWASLIGYAQIYVGRHFPSDVAAGALLGLYTGMFMAKILEYFWEPEYRLS
jgi:membrane-associated phospholipid phosphatase